LAPLDQPAPRARLEAMAPQERLVRQDLLAPRAQLDRLAPPALSVPRARLVRPVPPVRLVQPGPRVPRVRPDPRVPRARLVPLARPVRPARSVPLAPLDRRDRRDLLERQALQVPRDQPGLSDRPDERAIAVLHVSARRSRSRGRHWRDRSCGRKWSGRHRPPRPTRTGQQHARPHRCPWSDWAARARGDLSAWAFAPGSRWIGRTAWASGSHRTHWSPWPHGCVADRPYWSPWPHGCVGAATHWTDRPPRTAGPCDPWPHGHHRSDRAAGPPRAECHPGKPHQDGNLTFRGGADAGELYGRRTRYAYL
jgi:hypothetical protein